MAHGEYMKRIAIDKSELKKLYPKYSISNLVEIFGVSASTVRRNLKGLGFNLSKNTCRRFTLNESYFDKIDTEAKAYWLGFLLADGCIRNNSVTLTINLAKRDKLHLVMFLDHLESNYLIKPAPKKIVSVSLTSKQLTGRLHELGIVANKKTPFTKFSDSLLHHYWRGVIDGDGCITWQKHKRKNGVIKKQPVIKLVGNLSTCVAFRQFCLTITNTNAAVNPAEKKNAFRFRLHGPKAKLVIKILYDKATTALSRKLDRSYRIFEQLD